MDRSRAPSTAPVLAVRRPTCLRISRMATSPRVGARGIANSIGNRIRATRAIATRATVVKETEAKATATRARAARTQNRGSTAMMSIRPTLFFGSLVIASMFSLLRCGGSSLPLCNTGTAVQLASPTQGQGGVSTSIGRIVIVADGNANALYNSYGQWTITLADNTGQTWSGGGLGLVPDPGGPHPYAADFFYASSIPSLIQGRTYTAALGQPSGACQSVSVGSFST